MTLKNASFLAFVGALLLEAVLIFDVVHDAIGVAGGLIPALTILRTLVYAFAGLAVTIFFWIFSKTAR